MVVLRIKEKVWLQISINSKSSCLTVTTMIGAVFSINFAQLTASFKAAVHRCQWPRTRARGKATGSKLKTHYLQQAQPPRRLSNHLCKLARSLGDKRNWDIPVNRLSTHMLVSVGIQSFSLSFLLQRVVPWTAKKSHSKNLQLRDQLRDSLTLSAARALTQSQAGLSNISRLRLMDTPRLRNTPWILIKVIRRSRRMRQQVIIARTLNNKFAAPHHNHPNKVTIINSRRKRLVWSGPLPQDSSGNPRPPSKANEPPCSSLKSRPGS